MYAVVCMLYQVLSQHRAVNHLFGYLFFVHILLFPLQSALQTLYSIFTCRLLIFKFTLGLFKKALGSL